MLTFRQLNKILNVAWDTDNDSKIAIRFNEEDGGVSNSISVFASHWSDKVELDAPIKTAHLPATMYFKVYEMKSMYRALKVGYKDLDYLMPLELSDEGIKVLRGPGRGTFLKSVKP